MRKYQGKRLIRAGLMGVILTVLISLVGLQFDNVWTLFTAKSYSALFAEAGGLGPGDDVMISGINVGTVSNVSLSHGKALVKFTIDGNVRLGDETTVRIKTGSLLGKRVLTVVSSGARPLRSTDVIPVTRTSSPYSLTDALGDLTSNVTDTDTDALNQSLKTLASTLDQIAPQLGPTFDSLSRLSKSINTRNTGLRDLLRTASDVTGVLAKRSDRVNALILNSDALLSVLNDQRQEIVDLLANTSAVSQQLTALVAENERELAPTLDRLNSVTAMLEKNNDNIVNAMKGLNKYSVALGESVASGNYYNAFIANLMPGQFIQPFLDSALGLTPRAQLPLPHRERP
ncbi:mammalian cell entry protein [Mycolicibacter heraklionensis]|uniref:Mammalian cell entry protein n=1 Tax=Mycolicibacter heraklionensis TaxID=512402 RepID=A0ABR5FF88_9MYCO|nr:MCE family protein [Mycolicibacter heraklionensis]KLO28775.1 mammalian cell entry protein [Mycolicibacter heraklionensis]